MANFNELTGLIWQVADEILRGTFKAHEYGDATLPFVVLRRLDCTLESSKDEIYGFHQQNKKGMTEEEMAPILSKKTGKEYYNISKYDLKRLSQDQHNVEQNFWDYVNGFSKNVRDIIDNFELGPIIKKLEKNNLLFMMIDKFGVVDLSPKNVSNREIGLVYEELLRRFSEMSNETAGEHYTPRDVIRLMVSLLFAEHVDELKGKGLKKSIYDPACGTGGMLTLAKDYIHEEINPNIEIDLFGQERNARTYATARSELLVRGEDAGNIKDGSTFSQDGFQGKHFDYMLSNPPYGEDWKKEKTIVDNEAMNPLGRFYAGTPRISDGALLFLENMIAKMEKKGSRIAIIFNGSPLFTGDAGSGESNIRKWIIESDWLEAVVAMPTDLFFNTGIATYVWLITNNKPERRKGKVQLINAIDFFKPLRKSLGKKRKEVCENQMHEITEIYKSYTEGKLCKIFDNEDFGYTKVTVERPLMEDGKVVKDRKGKKKPNTKLRDYEKIQLKDDIVEYFKREVVPHVPDAWMDRSRDKIGYEMNFTKYFYEFVPLRPLEDIKADIMKLLDETEGTVREIIE